jgi:hypothetical protein
MSMYGQFQTDTSLETQGLIIDYGSFRVTIARAGGANKRFSKTLESKTKPFKRAIQTDTMDNERGLEILREVYAEAIVLNWETKKDNTFVQGIEAQDGSLLPFSKENIVATFKNLPDLFTDIQQQAEKSALFRKLLQEQDSKN